MSLLRRGIISSGKLGAGGGTGGFFNTATFNGATPSYINCGNAASLNPTTVISISLWGYFPSVSTSTMMLVAKYKAGIFEERDWYISINTSGKVSSTFHEDGSNSTAHGVVGSTTLSINTWHHLGMVYDGTDFKVYVNGIEDGNTNIGTVPIHAGTEQVTIGAGNGGGTYPFPTTGELAEAYVLSDVLSASDFLEIYNAGKPKQFVNYSNSVKDGAVLALALNSGFVSPYDDQSGESNDGTPSNAPITGTVLEYQ